MVQRSSQQPRLGKQGGAGTGAGAGAGAGRGAGVGAGEGLEKGVGAEEVFMPQTLLNSAQVCAYVLGCQWVFHLLNPCRAVKAAVRRLFTFTQTCTLSRDGAMHLFLSCCQVQQ